MTRTTIHTCDLCGQQSSDPAFIATGEASCLVTHDGLHWVALQNDTHGDYTDHCHQCVDALRTVLADRVAIVQRTRQAA